MGAAPVEGLHDGHGAALLPVDALGVAMTDGKTVGVCKYAMRNA